MNIKRNLKVRDMASKTYNNYAAYSYGEEEWEQMEAQAESIMFQAVKDISHLFEFTVSRDEEENAARILLDELITIEDPNSRQQNSPYYRKR